MNAGAWILKRIAVWIAVVVGLLIGASSTADTPQMLFQLGIGSAVGSAAMSPDGAYIAISVGRGVALLDAKKGVVLTHLTPPLLAPTKPHWISALAFSPNGRLLALGDASNEISIWNVRTATLVRTMQVPGPEGRVSSLQFDRTGKRLMASLYFTDGPVAFFNVATGKRLNLWYPTLQGRHARTSFADLSADGQRILTVSTLETPSHPRQTPEVLASALQMYDAQTGKILWQKNLKQRDLDWSARFVLGDSMILLVADKTAIICRASDGKALTAWHLNYEMERISISPDGKAAAITGLSGGGVYSLPDGHALKTLWDDNEPVSAFYAPNGQLLLETRHFQILAARTFRPLRTFPAYYCPVVAVIAASSDRQTYAMIAQLPTFAPMGPLSVPQSLLLLFNAGTGMVRRQMWLGRTWSESLSFSPDSRRIVCHSKGGWSLFDVATGALVTKTDIPPTDEMRMAGLPVRLGPVQFSADGSSLFASESDNTSESNNEIVFRSPATGTVLKTLNLGPEVGIDCYGLSPDGKTLAVSATETKDNQFSSDLELWDVAKQQRIKILTQTQNTRGNYPTLVFSPDGKTLVVGHLGRYGTRPLQLRKNTLDLYSMPDGIQCATIPDFADQQVAFSPDSKKLYTASGTIWDVKTAQALRHIGKYLHGNMLALAVDRSGQGNTLTSAFLSYFGSDWEHPRRFDDYGGMTIRDAKTGRKKAEIQMLPLKMTPSGLKAQWLTITPDGYYCGSPNVSHWISWHKGITILPKAPLVTKYNRPDHVQKALKEH